MLSFPRVVLSACVLAGGVFLATAAHAAPIIYFAENLSPGGTVSGTPVTTRDAFLSQLSGVGTEEFESFPAGTTPPMALAFPGSTGGISAGLSGSGVVLNFPNAGRYNTTSGGAQYLEVSGTFIIDFSAPISAFGFYGTDIGDFNGQTTIQLRATDGTLTNLVVPNTINGPTGSLLFWGFIDLDTAYNRITFGNTAAGTDFFGFDSMTIGDREQIVPTPEPASVLLFGLGLAAAHRRFRTRG